MVTNSPRGFVASRNLDGHSGNFRTERLPVSADNATALFMGDPVVRGAQGGVERFDPVNASTVALQRGLLGVVRAIYDTNGKPLTHSQPTNGPFLDASTAGFVEVITDPDVVYRVNCSATATRADIGNFAPVTFGVYNSAAGISGAGIDLTTVASGAGEQVFRVLNVAEAGFPDDVTEAAANNDIEVMIADHEYRRAHQRVGTG